MLTNLTPLYQGDVHAELPNLDHYKLADENYVYAPAEDTYLFCDALLVCYQNNKLLGSSYNNNNTEKLTVLELGSGSGCVITYIGSLLKENAIYHAIDINTKALEMTEKTSRLNNVQVELHHSDLFTSPDISTRFNHKLDILLFNPPYVPTDSSEVGSDGIEAAWAGGEDGREVIDRFLPSIDLLLSPIGACYIVLVRENKPLEIASILYEKYGLKSEIIVRRQAYNEDLMIMKISRNQSNE